VPAIARYEHLIDKILFTTVSLIVLLTAGSPTRHYSGL
jgi:hypothetical protein